MLELLVIITPIAFIDSLSVMPVAMVPLVILLSGKRPLAGSLGFLAGIVLTYLPFGLLLLFGLDSLFDALTEHLVAWWRQEPDVGELVIQVLVGAVMILFGFRMCERRRRRRQPKVQTGMTPFQALLLAAVINLSGMWGALPYFAAIAQILKVDLSNTGMVLAILYYNFIFILPLAVLLALRLAVGQRIEQRLERVNVFFVRWGNRLVVMLLIGLGFILIVDGIGRLFDSPLIAV